jgi:hypothetical protein
MCGVETSRYIGSNPSNANSYFLTEKQKKIASIHTPRSHDLPDQVSVRSDSWLGHQRAKTENTKSAITPEQMIGSSSNFYQRYKDT